MTSMLLSGVTSRRVTTRRLTVNVLESGPPDGLPVVFVHGNVSSAAFFQTTLLSLPPAWRGIAIDLRGFGDTDPAPVDARRGLRDFSDDVLATADALGLDRFSLVGWSMGGGIALQCLLEASERISSLTLISPISPYGFGGTRGAEGTIVSPDGAGTGGGTVNPDFVARLSTGDRSADVPTSPRQVLRLHYLRPGRLLPDEDMYVDSMLTTRVGADNYPGDARPSPVWPHTAPGDRGILNALSPVRFRIESIAEVTSKPDILWVRGDSDVIVSDTSSYDLAYLGSLGLVPGWPGPLQMPPQPMVRQMRNLLDHYVDGGGRYREVILSNAAHSPHLEKPDQFLDLLGATVPIG